jgi:NAD(P)-dependent dehydrogenase (short-subunit alcohol dehydrogenase family)
VTSAFLARTIPTATIFNISSGIAHLPAAHFAGFSAYAASKIASTRFFLTMFKRRTQTFMLSIHPGQVVADMALKVGMITTIDTGKMPRSTLLFLSMHVMMLYCSTNFKKKVELPADFVVWAASPEAKFLKGKLAWSNWDVE